MTSGRFRTVMLSTVCVAWALAAGTGLMRLWAYADRPAPSAAAPETWPAGTKLSRDPQRPTLVLFAHPQCPCSRATIGELSRLIARTQGRAAVHILFYRPASAEAGWERTDLWRSAAAIPGVQVASDEDGREAATFGALASGQTLLYDAHGKLAFSGGITFARGHSGDNAGLSALASLLNEGTAETRRTSVFGCLIRGSLAAASTP